MKKIFFLWLLATLFPMQQLAAQSQFLINGYANKQSFVPGDTMTVYAHSLLQAPNAKMYLYDVTNTKVDSVTTLLLPQVIANPNPWENGFGYLPTFTYSVPALPSGIYNWNHTIYFIIKNASRNADITVVYPTNTDAAYNSSGGRNFYGNPKATTVSFLRPLSGNILNTTYHEAAGFLKWIKQQQTYNVQVISDLDMDNYSEIAASEVIVLIGHSEYWTRQARYNFDQFVNSGKDALVLSGNTMWWQVRYSADKTRLICYKDSAADPELNPLHKTITWNKPSLQYSIINSIGADWAHGAYGRRNSGHGGFKITNPNSPLLKGTGLCLGDTLKLSTVEYDGTLLAGFNNQGFPILDKAALGFYKAELIGYDFGLNNVTPPVGHGTFIAFQKTPVSGKIINAASMNWCDTYVGMGSGLHAARLKIITRNMLDRLLENRTIFNDLTLVASDKEASEQIELTIYPNPGSGQFSVKVPQGTTEPVQLLLYDQTGHQVHAEILSPESNYTFDISELPNGSYLYQLISNTVSFTNGQLLLMH